MRKLELLYCFIFIYYPVFLEFSFLCLLCFIVYFLREISIRSFVFPTIKSDHNRTLRCTLHWCSRIQINRSDLISRIRRHIDIRCNLNLREFSLDDISFFWLWHLRSQNTWDRSDLLKERINFIPEFLLIHIHIPLYFINKILRNTFNAF